jgi:predicted Zn-dependent protease
MLPVIHRIVLLIVTAAYLLTGTAAAGDINLPELGDASLGTLTPIQERRLGEEFMRKARTALAFLDDPEISDYLQNLGQQLVSHSDSAYKDFRFFAINDASINAFAVPGGFIGVHTGLILATQSESELASVLAHETAHVSQRHIPRLIAESERATLPALAAIMASILLASSGHSGAEAGLAITSAAVTQRGINYTRTFEEEADRVGMGLLAKSRFDPHGMPAFFERMQNLNRHNETSLPEFLRTHPVTTNRIADARNRAAQLATSSRPDSSEFHHVRAKLRALAAGNPAEIVRGFRENLAQGKYRDAQAERYGYTLALLRHKQFDAARSEIARLRKSRPQRLAYRIVQAEIEIAAGNMPKALEYYAAAQRDNGNNGILLRHHAAALLKAGQTRAARDLLEPVIRRTPDDPTLFRMYGTAAGESGQPAQAHQALGEYYYLTGNPAAAIQQFQIATRHAGDNFYLQSSLEARIKAIRDEMTVSSATPAK